MSTWKLTLEYDGTSYSGWQEQRNARTVMGDLRKAVEEFFRSEVELHGAGRTDAGVHAAAQVAHLRVPGARGPAPEVILRELNDRLPATIAVIEVEPKPDSFHARHDAQSRSYVYQISTRKSAFSKKYVWWIKDPLDIELMQRAAAMLAGRHDFQCFRAPDPSKPGESTIVVVEKAEIEVEDSMITFRIVASHYLWRMVRRIVGVLVRLGRHEIEVADFELLLNAKCDKRLDVAGWTAPAAGLFLEEIRY